MTQIPLVSLAAADIFLRAMGVGALLLLLTLLLRWPMGQQRLLQSGVVISVGAYLLLTAPIPDADYGYLRNVLLVLTDAFAYLAWFLALTAFDDEFKQRLWPAWLKLALAIYGLYFVYFLGIQEGQGVFHDVIHAIALILMAHIIYVAVRGFENDLVDSRRRQRILLIIVISSYSILVVALEFMDERIRNDALFSLVNAGLLTLAILVTARLLLHGGSSTTRRSTPASTGVSPGGEGVPEEYAALKRKLDDFILAKRYQQAELSISALATQLRCSEHHLRRLINRVMGYRNFNAFLNDLRVQDAARHLADPRQQNKPILTLALELGYGSIGPFNRAFKAALGQTPGEYRSTVQNRR